MRNSALSLLIFLFAAIPLHAATAVEHAAAGRIALDRDEHQKAADLFAKAVALEPRKAEYHYLLGAAVREQPNSARAHYLLGAFLMNDKNWDGALHEFDMALELDPAFMPTYLRIGQHAARSESNYARGEESLRKYLTYKPTSEEPSLAAAWHWLGRVQEKQGKKADARTSYANALKLAPGDKEVTAALKRVS